MKKTYFNQLISFTLCLAVASALGSCSDWNQTESLDIKQPTIEGMNPELYARYLESLRSYKQSDHKIVYVTYDNSHKVATSRADHISVIPDSVDIISLIFPDNLAAWEQKEMEEVRTKGTKVVYTISYDSIRVDYDRAKKAFDDAAALEPQGEEPAEFTDFASYLTSCLDQSIALCDKYNYDGITIGYVGRYLLTMPESEKELHVACQNIIASKITEWASTHSSKMVIFEGQPKNLVDKSMLALCRYIIIPALGAPSIDGVHQQVLNALVPGVPTNNIIVGAVPFAAENDAKYSGYFANGLPVLSETAYWIVNHNTPYTKSGIAIYGIKSDYFYRTFVYYYTRGAIDIMNPSAKL